MTRLNHQHFIFTARADAEAMMTDLAGDLDAGEALVIVPDATGRKFIVSLLVNGQHEMYV